MDNEYSPEVANVFQSVCQNCYKEYFFHKPYSDVLCFDCWLVDSGKEIDGNNFEAQHDRLMTYRHFETPVDDLDLVVKNYLSRFSSKLKRTFDFEYRKIYNEKNKADIKFWRQNYRRGSYNFKAWRKEYRARVENREKELSYKKEYNRRPEVMEVNRLYQAKLRRLRKKALLN